MNRAIGSRYESVLIELLSKNGWWCHLFAYKPEGQPCDVVAIRNNIGILLDVKHCSAKRFPFTDIRPNQKTCFSLAKQKGNKILGFAIFFEVEQTWRWLSYDKLVKMEEQGAKSVLNTDLPYLFEKNDETDN